MTALCALGLKTLSRMSGGCDESPSEVSELMNDETPAGTGSPIACDMSAIEAGVRELHLANAVELFRAVGAIRELPGGYAFRLPNASDTLLKAAEFVSLERLCCPFLGFTLEVEPEGGGVWLRLTGREGVKEFIREEVSELLGGAIDWAGVR
jgi:hypothetical protein